MKEWLQNELYSELIQMPLWTVCAFGSLQEGDILKAGDVRFRLMMYLACKHIKKVPDELYDADYRHNWKCIDFEEPVKSAVIECKKIITKNR